jgi:hypothetical protein
MQPRTDAVHIAQFVTDDQSQVIIDCLASIVENTMRPLKYTVFTHGHFCGDGVVLRGVEVFCKKYRIAYEHILISSAYASSADILKFEIPFLLEHEERVIILNTNTLAFDDIGRLWDLDMYDLPIVALNESQYPWDADGQQVLIPDGEGAFQTGVYLINIHRYIEVFSQKGDQRAAYHFMHGLGGSQPLFNHLFSGDIYYLPPGWGHLLCINHNKLSPKLSEANAHPSLDYLFEKPLSGKGQFDPIYRSMRRRREILHIGIVALDLVATFCIFSLTNIVEKKLYKSWAMTKTLLLQLSHISEELMRDTICLTSEMAILTNNCLRWKI